jgi:diadenosine hexaphosphate hydrolase (ATP-forming)
MADVLRVNIAGGVILNSERKVLLVYNEYTDSWTYPKGHVKPGEDIFEAAKREIREEANMDLSDLEYVCKLPVYERGTRQQKNKIKVMHMFLFRTSNSRVESNTTDITELKWVSIDEAVGYFSYDEEKKFFESIKGRLME